MRQMQERLAADTELAGQLPTGARATTWATAPSSGDVPEIAGVSAGGMPDRVKCLHVLVGHALAAGPGVNPFGDEALRRDRRTRAACADSTCAERSVDG